MHMFDLLTTLVDCSYRYIVLLKLLLHNYYFHTKTLKWTTRTTIINQLYQGLRPQVIILSTCLETYPGILIKT